MIELVGTSHISSESVSDASRQIEESNPDIVAIELDPKRYQALLAGQQTDYSLQNPLMSLIQYIQQQLSERTGITPGQELLTAASEAEKLDIPLALIDQDIAITMDRLRDIGTLEKIKLTGFLLLGGLLPFGDSFDLDTVPNQDLIEELLVRLQVSFPDLHEALIEERNDIMAARLLALEDEYGDVLAFVGAGHVSGIQDRIRDKTY